MRDTVVVFPCYNEEKRLDSAALGRALADERSLRFVLVNDGSVDGTGAMLREFGASWPDRVAVVELARNSGKAEAVRQGVLHALTLGPELVGYWDADLSTPLDEIPRFVRCFDRRETLVVLGSRIRLLGRHVERSAIRHYVGRIFATLAAHALSVAVYDTQCGAKMFRVTDATRQLFERPFELNWAFDVEILARLVGLQRRAGFKVEEACVELVLDRWVEPGGSKLGFKQVPKVLFELARLHGVVRRERSS